MVKPSATRRLTGILSLFFVALALAATSWAANKSFTEQLTTLSTAVPTTTITLPDHRGLATLTFHVETTGAPSTCTYYIEGQQEGRTGWVRLNNASPADCATNPNLAIVISGQIWSKVRGNLTAFVGGTTPTVACTLEGVQE